MTDWAKDVLDWWMSCARKGKLSEQSAKRIVRRAEQRERLLLYRYRCRHCSGWHLSRRHPRTLLWEEAMATAEEEGWA